MERILIVEDDPPMLRGLKDNFENAGFEVFTACTGPAGLNLARQQRPDLILLDIMLPLLDGFEVCAAIRKENSEVPILMLTARDEEPDIVRGLKLGADGYVTKPFGIRELMARAEAMLRRRRQQDGARYRFAGHEFDLDKRCLTDATGEVVKLSPREFALLQFFVEHPGRGFSREALLRQVWGSESEASPRTVDRFVTVLRSKLGSDTGPAIIETIREFGYRLGCEVEAVSQENSKP